MARKITMFELHFDGAHFGPSFGEEKEEKMKEVMEEETVDDSESAESAPTRSRTMFAVVGAMVVISALGSLVFRRFRGGRGDDFEVEEIETTENIADQ
ncbi:hypothetical protein [Haladaptatus sp. NG-SE-30]